MWGGSVIRDERMKVFAKPEILSWLHVKIGREAFGFTHQVLLVPVTT